MPRSHHAGSGAGPSPTEGGAQDPHNPTRPQPVPPGQFLICVRRLPKLPGGGAWPLLPGQGPQRGRGPRTCPGGTCPWSRGHDVHSMRPGTFGEWQPQCGGRTDSSHRRQLGRKDLSAPDCWRGAETRRTRSVPAVTTSSREAGVEPGQRNRLGVPSPAPSPEEAQVPETSRSQEQGFLGHSLSKAPCCGPHRGLSKVSWRQNWTSARAYLAGRPWPRGAKASPEEAGRHQLTEATGEISLATRATGRASLGGRGGGPGHSCRPPSTPAPAVPPRLERAKAAG